MFLIRFVSGHNLCSHLLDVTLWQMSAAPIVDCQKGFHPRIFFFILKLFLIDITLHISRCTIQVCGTHTHTKLRFLIFTIFNLNMVLYLTIFKMQTRPRCSYDVMSIKLAIYFLLLPKGKMVTILFP